MCVCVCVCGLNTYTRSKEPREGVRTLANDLPVYVRGRYHRKSLPVQGVKERDNDDGDFEEEDGGSYLLSSIYRIKDISSAK